MLASDRISKTSINSLNIFIFITVYLTCISSDPEALLISVNNKPILLLGGNKGDQLVSAVKKIRNLGNQENIEIEELRKIKNEEIVNNLDIFINNTLFVGKNGSIAKGGSLINVIFSDEEDINLTIDSFPAHYNYEYLDSIVIPVAITNIPENAFDNIIADKPEQEKLIVVFENRNAEVSSNILDKVALVFGNDGTHYSYQNENNPIYWANYFNQKVIIKYLDVINDQMLKPDTEDEYIAKLLVHDMNSNGSFDVDVEIFDASGGPLDVVNGVVFALNKLKENGVEAARVYPLNVEPEDFNKALEELGYLEGGCKLENFEVLSVAVLVVLGLFYNIEEDQFPESFYDPSTLFTFIMSLSLSDLDEKNTVQVVGEVNDKDNGNNYEIKYNFTFTLRSN